MSFLTILKEVQTFTGKDDNEYSLSPLTLRDLGKFVSWVKFKPYRDALNADLPQEKCEQIKEECKRGKVKEEVSEGVWEQFDIHVQSSIVISEMSSIEGAIKLFELSLHKLHPGILFDDICDPDTLLSIQAQLFELNFMPEEDEEPEKN